MPNKRCTICYHKETEKINQDLAARVSYRKLNQIYGVALASLVRHNRVCIGNTDAEMIAQKRFESTFHFESELMRLYRKAAKMVDAIERWLVDADNPEEFDIGPRDTEILVTYLDHDDLNERGKPSRRKGVLSDLLKRVSKANIEVMEVASLAMDNRKLYLDAFKTLNDRLEQIAKFEGHWKQDKQNPANVEAERLRSMIESRAKEKGIDYNEELQMFLDRYGDELLRPDIKTQLVSDLSQ